MAAIVKLITHTRTSIAQDMRDREVRGDEGDEGTENERVENDDTIAKG